MKLKKINWRLNFKHINIFGLILTTRKYMHNSSIDIDWNSASKVVIQKNDIPMITAWYKEMQAYEKI